MTIIISHRTLIQLKAYQVIVVVASKVIKTSLTIVNFPTSKAITTSWQLVNAEKPSIVEDPFRNLHELQSHLICIRLKPHMVKDPI